MDEFYHDLIGLAIFCLIVFGGGMTYMGLFGSKKNAAPPKTNDQFSSWKEPGEYLEKLEKHQNTQKEGQTQRILLGLVLLGLGLLFGKWWLRL